MYAGRVGGDAQSPTEITFPAQAGNHWHGRQILGLIYKFEASPGSRLITRVKPGNGSPLSALGDANVLPICAVLGGKNLRARTASRHLTRESGCPMADPPLLALVFSNESPFAIAEDKAYREDNWIPAFAGKVDKGKVALTGHRINSATFEQGYVLKFDVSGDQSISCRYAAFEMCESPSAQAGTGIQ